MNKKEINKIPQKQRFKIGELADWLLQALAKYVQQNKQEFKKKNHIVVDYFQFGYNLYTHAGKKLPSKERRSPEHKT